MNTARAPLVRHDPRGDGIVVRASKGYLFLRYSEARCVADLIHDFMDDHETTNREWSDAS